MSLLAAATIVAATPAHLLAQEAAGDPVDVAADHYSVELENDAVRVLRVNYAPGAKSEMHSHPGHVVVFLSDATYRAVGADGATLDLAGKRGDAAWAPAGAHTIENIGDTDAVAVLVEVPTATGDAMMMDAADEMVEEVADEMAAVEVAGDPVAVAPSQYSVVFENESVRVLRVNYAAGASSAVHAHPGLVVVNLTDGMWKSTGADGVANEGSNANEDIGWMAAETHSMQNTGEGAGEAILVEIKGH
jgi:quercetin dioxygenase-like cupin family protein